MSGSLIDGSQEQWPWVALRMVPGLRLSHFHDLLRRFGDPAQLLAASEADLSAAGLPAATIRTLRSGVPEAAAKADVEQAERAGARIVRWTDAAYPAALRAIHDPPPYLYVLGDLGDPTAPSVAVVGSRAATPYGRTMCRQISADLARAGVTIVSGLAYGIDAAAHRGALEAGGRTIAVMGSGVDVAYPREHGPLMSEIVARGAVVSEFFMGTPPRRANFPVRNRIISGLARGTLVVEASERSGSLITARLALEQNRDVFAVPGAVTSERSRGALSLIRNGAKLVTDASHVLEEMRFGGAPTPRVDLDGDAISSPASVASAVFQGEICQRITEALRQGPVNVDFLVERTGLTPPDVLRMLLQLELAGVVHQFPGATFGLRGGAEINAT